MRYLNEWFSKKALRGGYNFKVCVCVVTPKTTLDTGHLAYYESAVRGTYITQKQVKHKTDKYYHAVNQVIIGRSLIWAEV